MTGYELNKRKVGDMLTMFGIYSNFRTEFKSYSDSEQRLIARVLYGLKITHIDPDGETFNDQTFDEFVAELTEDGQ